MALKYFIVSFSDIIEQSNFGIPTKNIIYQKIFRQAIKLNPSKE